MSGPSGSTLARAAACPASFALARAHSISESATTGTEIHAYLAIVSRWPSRRSEALAALPPRLRDACAAIDLVPVLDGVTVTAVERAYAYDVETGRARHLGDDIAREYGALGPNEIACTLDVEGTVRSPVDADPWPWVRDWKTGRDVGDPRDSWQLALQALCVRSADDDGVDVGYVYVDPETGLTRTAACLLDALDLDSWAERIREVHARVRAAMHAIAAGATPDVTEGEHCRYCPAHPYCPAKTALVRSMAAAFDSSEDGADLAQVVSVLPVEAVGLAWQRLGLLRQHLDRVEAALRERIGLEGSVPLPGGKRVLRIVETQGREYIPAAAARALLTRLGATPEDIAAITARSRPSLRVQESAAAARARGWAARIDAGQVAQDDPTDESGSEIPF